MSTPGGFVGGKLKLKGGEALKGGVKKKKKKDKGAGAGGSGGGGGNELALASAPSGGAEAGAAGGDEQQQQAAAGGEPVRTRDGYVLPAPALNADRRTEAEKRHAERLRRLEEERVRKLAAKGYRDRVKEFNEHLASLSEHHDIPKVGPG